MHRFFDNDIDKYTVEVRPKWSIEDVQCMALISVMVLYSLSVISDTASRGNSLITVEDLRQILSTVAKVTLWIRILCIIQ